MYRESKIRGLTIVVSGFISFLLFGALAGIAGRPLNFIFTAVAFLSMVTLFFFGTLAIATDKGYSFLIGLALGLIAPLGTLIAVLLEDKTSQRLKRRVDNIVGQHTNRTSQETNT